MNKNTIAITGGSGFIGSSLIWGLNRMGMDNILVVDEFGVGEKWKNLINLKFIDIIDKDIFIEHLERGSYTISGIIHMGAITDTTERDVGLLLRNNYEYTKRLAMWCVKNKKRFVYASSGATYGDGSEGFSDEHNILSLLRPLNMYGYSKHLFDLWALKNDILSRIAGLKYFNVFGSNEYHKGDMRSVACKAFERIKKDGVARIFRSYRKDYKDGWQLRDFIYVKDVVDMTLCIYDKAEANGIFNIGTGSARSFYELVMAIFKTMGIKPKIEYIDIPEQIRDKYQYFTQADMKKTFAVYKKKISSLEDGIGDYLKNYLLTSDPYLGNSDCGL